MLMENGKKVLTMPEYIEREALLDDIDAAMKNGGMGYVVGQTLKRYVKRQQAADVAPVRHGRWECQKPCPVCGEDRFKGLDADIWSDWEPPYCPNCGARMDQKEETE